MFIEELKNALDFKEMKQRKIEFFMCSLNHKFGYSNAFQWMSNFIDKTDYNIKKLNHTFYNYCYFS